MFGQRHDLNMGEAHIDHIRDFFVTITTDEASDYCIKSLQDNKIDMKGETSISQADWENLLDPALFKGKELVITEFDCF